MDTPPAKSLPVATALLVIAGILFMALWIFAHGVWMYFAAMGTLMANDSGAATMRQWEGLIVGVFVGQVLAALAGVSGGAAFFWRGKRRLMLVLFAILFVLGAILQAGSFYAYFHRA